MLGILVPLFWQAALVYAVLWVGLLLILRISSVAGMAAAASAPVTAAVLGDERSVPDAARFRAAGHLEASREYPPAWRAARNRASGRQGLSRPT